ncbi:2-aminomuconate deaminase [Shimia sp. SK013]|uniref:RidA family protein n=1 Tax=Shimia sp. SK013 TaxID=1389006 RepID=UPI0006CC44F5|nr:RidA family protein [Shimia sp. SK013]KPA21286.1 2-aminomuconate deaminase [Shimia sp. SK013]
MSTPTRGPAFRSSPSNPVVQEIQTIPERHTDMPYAPAIRLEAPGDMLFLSGATASPLYHAHPHEWEDHNHANDIEAQAHKAMLNVLSILEHQGLGVTDVVKVTKYLTDMRDQDGLNTVLSEYFGDWKPASTMICVNSLSTPGARIELDVIATYPKTNA